MAGSLIELQIGGVGVLSIVAGFAAALSIFAFYLFAYGDERSRKLKRRMADVKDRRAQMRSALVAPEKAGSGRDLAMMEKAIERLQLGEQVQDKSLKLRLVRAGLRKESDIVRFLFMRVAAPIALAIVGFAVYALVLAKPGEFQLIMAVGAALGGAMLGYLLPSMQLDSRTSKRKKEIRQNWPDALDLLTICVEAGMSMEQAFNRVADELGPDAISLAEELKLTTAELSYLGDRRKALENLALRADLPMVRSVVSAMIQAERYGTPIATALRVISAEGRFERLAVAESKAAALPAKLTVPMMVFFLPVLFIVILGPSILQVMDS